MIEPSTTIKPRGAPGLLLAMLLGMAACADDIPAVPATETETGTTTGSDTLPPPDGTTTTTTGLDTTESASTTESVSTSSSSGSPDSTSTGETGTTGEPTLPGHTVSQLVSAGTRTSSRSYTLVHTLGQPSPLQSTHESTSYRLQGGLVGANGSPP